MSEAARKFWKGAFRTVLAVLLSAAVSAALWYLQNGWPIAGNLKKHVESGEIVSVRITQRDNAITVTDPEKLALAAGCVQMLSVSLPGAASDETPETEYIFTYADGGVTRIGVSDQTIFRDGKQYAPQGKYNGNTELFYNCTEGIFFLHKAVEAEK